MRVPGGDDCFARAESVGQRAAGDLVWVQVGGYVNIACQQVVDDLVLGKVLGDEQDMLLQTKIGHQLL